MKLEKCTCGNIPLEKDYLHWNANTKAEMVYYVECQQCDKNTKNYKTRYNAKRAWNRARIKERTIKPNDTLYWSITNTTNDTFQIGNFEIYNTSLSPKEMTDIHKKNTMIPVKIGSIKKSKFKTWWNRYLGFMGEI